MAPSLVALAQVTVARVELSRQTGSMSTRTAAFFDLDRTLLAGGSGPVFAEAFAQLGVKTPHVPGQELLFKFFDLVGESYVVMQLAKRASSRAKGLRRDDVMRVAESAADVLVLRVQPYAAALMRSHREQGDLLVLATTSPYDLVAPLARRLGFDAVVATRYAELEGVYTGELDDAGFVWGPGKLAAVKAWSTENNVDVGVSAAYSDSVFDAPLLGAVGRPTAVNPDYRLRALATVRRWPVRTLDTPDGVPSINGVEPFDFIRTLTRPEFFPGIRFRFSGVDNIPSSGPAIIAVNHRSYFDPLVISFAIAKVGRNGRFLGKKEVFDAPIVGQLATMMGGIRVDRGTGSDAPVLAASERIAAGEVVVILPEGTIPRGEAFFDPILHGKTGVARLAAMHPDVPVIPIGLWGTENVWPRSAKVPNLLQFTDPIEVTVQVGRPVSGLVRTSSSARVDTDAIMSAIMELLPPESRVARVVSESELAKTTPDGRVPSKSKAVPAAATKPGGSRDAEATASRTNYAKLGLTEGQRKASKSTKTAKSSKSAKTAKSSKSAKTAKSSGKRSEKALKPESEKASKSASKSAKSASSQVPKSKTITGPKTTAKPADNSAAAPVKRVPPTRRLDGTLSDR